jgi:hypothetical protein
MERINHPDDTAARDMPIPATSTDMTNRKRGCGSQADGPPALILDQSLASRADWILSQ